MDNEKPFKYQWLDKMASESGPKSPTTRHICHSLLSHMDNDGRCYPSIGRLQKATNLSRPCIIKHIKLAAKERWLKVKKERHLNHSWKRNVYQAVIPTKLRGVVNEVNQVVNDVNRVGNEIDQGSKRGLPGVVNEVNPNNQENKKENNQQGPPPAPPSIGGAGRWPFEKFNQAESMRLVLSTVDNDIQYRRPEKVARAKRILSELKQEEIKAIMDELRSGEQWQRIVSLMVNNG